MGLLGAPGSFQRLMEIVIHNLKNIIAYIDDLLVHTKTHEEQLDSQIEQKLSQNQFEEKFFWMQRSQLFVFQTHPRGSTPRNR